ncbi:MAG: FliM/FliN family flagellar motor switch protein [Thermoguttaceae bacterium]
MSEAHPQFIDDVLAACKVGVEEAGASLARAFDGEVQMTLGSQGTLRSAESQLNLRGKGLLVLLKTDQTTVVMTIPAAKGLVPAWCARPDPTGESKLATLAQELGMILLPETWVTNDFSARWVTNLADALGRGGVSQDAVVVPLAVSQGGQPKGNMGVVWPVENPAGLFAAPPSEPQPAKELIGQAMRIEKPTLRLTSGDLPPYTRSLLRIKVPVVVTLAEKRQKLSRIVELGPGSIIQFDKSCEEMLDLEVGNQAVASGEAVKVGDKFGLRIIAMVMPDERFTPVTSKDAKKFV